MKPPSVKRHFYIQEILKKYMPHCNLYQQVKMEQYKTQSDCNDAVECDLICQCVAKDLVESHTFEG